MTKSQEISILLDTIARLGPDSYCGPWLSGQIGAIESAINSDFGPSAYALSPADAAREAQSILAEARKEAAEIRLRAVADGDRERERARAWAGELRQSVRTQLESVLAKI
ncbi:MAG: hypothetical protein WCG75_00160 [Armatimonadota bacterium]